MRHPAEPPRRPALLRRPSLTAYEAHAWPEHTDTVSVGDDGHLERFALMPTVADHRTPPPGATDDVSARITRDHVWP